MTTFDVVADIARSVAFESAGALVVDGATVPLPAGVAQLVDRPERWAKNAGALLAQLLYENYYLGQAVRPDRFASNAVRPKPAAESEHQTFTAILRDANAGRGWFAKGWSIVERDGDRCRVTDGEVFLDALEAELRTPDAGPLEVGRPVEVRFPQHLPHASPGYYLAVSDAGPPRSDERRCCRVYVNVACEGAPVTLRRLTSLFCGRGIRASVKVLNDPGTFSRPDSMVSLLEVGDFLAVRQELGTVLDCCGSFLRDFVPAFAKQWKRGVGLADDPPARRGAAVSFGEHRSRVIAAALAGAYAPAGAAPASADVPPLRRLAAIVAGLKESGLDPSRLWLEPAAPDVFPESETAATPAEACR